MTIGAIYQLPWWVAMLAVLALAAVVTAIVVIATRSGGRKGRDSS